MSTRRAFITNTGKAMVAGGLVTFAENGDSNMLENKFIHHVYFWLQNEKSKEDRAMLIEGLKKLSKVKTIKTFHIGQPADTKRDVIDSSYAVSWFTIFDNAADQQSYQTDPIHLKFVEEYSHLWSKVVVYDTVDVK
ncbi:Dabb family protein [Niastella caeni]|uniref:Dabb family protein n=1 Tax=Niastella caeni TaxID=2569763 RepID=A0A4S8I0X7_9BACT|nr:Dabb family protein [Niastella caeni]THU41773.1 Dabb family protein [Niastella caeni]